jgi:hypothetical protein
MARVVPSYDEGQLILAGIRVRSHRDGRPPLLEDVAETIDMPADLLRVLVLEMEKLGIIRQLANAFETRLAVDDHLKAEDLPKEGSGARLNSEVEEFRKAFREKQKDLKNTFGSGAFSKKSEEKMSRLEEELKKFKGRGGPAPGSILGEPPKYDDDDD